MCISEVIFYCLSLNKFVLEKINNITYKIDKIIMIIIKSNKTQLLI